MIFNRIDVLFLKQFRFNFINFTKNNIMKKIFHLINMLHNLKFNCTISVLSKKINHIEIICDNYGLPVSLLSYYCFKKYFLMKSFFLNQYKVQTASTNQPIGFSRAFQNFRYKRILERTFLHYSQRAKSYFYIAVYFLNS